MSVSEYDGDGDNGGVDIVDEIQTIPLSTILLNNVVYRMQPALVVSPL